jgi:hypothetical protein
MAAAWHMVAVATILVLPCLTRQRRAGLLFAVNITAESLSRIGVCHLFDSFAFCFSDLRFAVHRHVAAGGRRRS